MHSKIKVKDARIQEERDRCAELQDQKAELDQELQDCHFWMAEYEKGHGLTEAVVYQRKLKGDIKRLQKDLRSVNQKLSERITAYDLLYETCRRLKKKCDLP